MCRFVETIRVENGEPARLPLHQARLDATLHHFAPAASRPELATLLHGCPAAGLYKARVVYDLQGTTEVDFQPYAVRPVRTLRLVEDDAVDYAFKYENRSALNALRDRRAGCDEVIIVRNGLLTDTSYTNLALFDGTGWFTPCTPLLRGTRRRYLLERGVLQERDLRPADLPRYSSLCLFNAMIPFRTLVLPVSAVVG